MGAILMYGAIIADKKLHNSLMRNTKERILLFKQSTFWEQGGIRTRYRLNPKSTGIFPQCTVELTLYYVKIPAICTCNLGYHLRIKLQWLYIKLLKLLGLPRALLLYADENNAPSCSSRLLLRLSRGYKSKYVVNAIFHVW